MEKNKIMLLIIFLNIFILDYKINSSDIDKSYEISIGGGFEGIINIGAQNNWLEYQDYNNTSKTVMVSNGINFILPFSFIYYPKSNFGIGFLIQNGFFISIPNYYYNTDNVSNIFLFRFGIKNELLLINKFGDLKNKLLSIEYGLILVNGALNGNMSYFADFLGYKFYIGQDKHYKNGFKFSIGGFFENYYKIYPYQISFKKTFYETILNSNVNRDLVTLNDNFFGIFSFGISLKFSYSYINKIN